MRKLVTLLVLLFNTFIIKAQSISGSLSCVIESL